jgi:hypothetical protein
VALTNQEKRGVWLLAIVGALVAAVLGAYVWQKLWKDPIGPDNCIYEDKRLLRKAISDQTVILVDQSEDLSPSHMRQVKELLLDYIADDERLPVRSAVIIYAFGKEDFQPGGKGQDLRPRANLCRPPSSGNVVYENKRKLERTFRDKFVVPLYETLEHSLNHIQGQRSPILEMLQYASRTQDIKESAGDPHKKTLVIVSDMLQHTAAFSHYRGDTYAKFASVQPMLGADLRGWEVRILYIQRYGNDQRLQVGLLNNFWMRYFHDAGAKLARVDRIP